MPATTQAAFIGRVMAALSPERLDRFSKGSSEPRWEALARYAQNVAICEAFYPLLHHLEVVLRNSIDRAARQAWPYRKWAHVDSWLDATPSPLHKTFGQPRVLDAKKQLLGWDAKSATFKKPTKTIVHGHLVAELSFGFWTGMLNRYYTVNPSPRTALWPNHLTVAFPHLGNPSLTDISTRINDIRHFRNRIFHYEPIWQRPNLADDRTEILTVIRWMSPEVARSVEGLDRVPLALSADFQRRLRAAVYRESKR